MKLKVAVLGASPNPDRYSNRAVRSLRQAGHAVIPVNPGHAEIEGLPAVSHLRDIGSGTVHTLTMYVGAQRSQQQADDILALRPNRVIFNPGSENPGLAARPRDAGVEVIEGCTLVMLSTGTFS